MRKTKDLKKKIRANQKGITLIALVITIIVMLILVAVTITMAVNGGLFGKASAAGKQTNEALRKENELASGKVNIAGTVYNSMQDYVDTLTGQSVTGGSGNGTGDTGTGDTDIQIKISGSDYVTVGDTITLYLISNEDNINSEEIEWTSSNPNIATVSDGEVNGISVAEVSTVTITATYQGKVATKKIRVGCAHGCDARSFLYDL